MRRTVVRLIAAREARDQLRDRRTMFLILGLPVLMYPLFAGVGVVFVTILKGKTLTVGVVGLDHLPPPRPDPSAVAGAAAGAAFRAGALPPLVVDGAFVDRYVADDPEGAGGRVVVRPLDSAGEAPLAARQVDAIVVVDPELVAKLDRGDPADRPVVRIIGREGEENSKLATRRAAGVVRKWAADVKAVRFFRRGLPADFDAPVEIRDPQSDKTLDKKIADEFRDVLVKVIPLLLVMWILTGSIYPAIDMTAGEKERGTMETLLISPAERGEIVGGKFIAVTALGFATALWNIALLVGVVAFAQVRYPEFAVLSLGGLAAGVLAALPLAMLLAACCLTLGVFARSTKEGNYYMVPLFFLVLPLAYLSMAPGFELDARTSWVPVTNALLLQQRLMSVRADPFPWQHVPAVVISLTACIAAGLWAAAAQFRREAVLFREAEHGRGKWGLFGRK